MSGRKVTDSAVLVLLSDFKWLGFIIPQNRFNLQFYYKFSIIFNTETDNNYSQDLSTLLMYFNIY